MKCKVLGRYAPPAIGVDAEMVRVWASMSVDLAWSSPCDHFPYPESSYSTFHCPFPIASVSSSKYWLRFGGFDPLPWPQGFPSLMPLLHLWHAALHLSWLPFPPKRLSNIYWRVISTGEHGEGFYLSTRAEFFHWHENKGIYCTSGPVPPLCRSCRLTCTYLGSSEVPGGSSYIPCGCAYEDWVLKEKKNGTLRPPAPPLFIGPDASLPVHTIPGAPQPQLLPMPMCSYFPNSEPNLAWYSAMAPNSYDWTGQNRYLGCPPSFLYSCMSSCSVATKLPVARPL